MARHVRTGLLIFCSYLIAAVCGAILVLLMLGAAANLVEWLPGAIVLVLVAGSVPFVIAIGLLHWLGKTGWLAHAVAGLAVSFFAVVMMAPGLLANPVALAENWPMLVSGAAAGVIYWLAFRALDRLIPK